ncbi:MAG: membrane protein insertion efficiency factor YidD [Ruminococcaceae bacterium]|nr:membrane protein insertion efficiency factor YidD [Oscillospiraceae bacterium]
MKKLLVLLLQLYQRYISPLKKPSCRFYPTCSQYAIDAITKKGALRGSYLAVRRLCKCHPFHEGGYDPVE